MQEQDWPRVELRTWQKPARGENLYRAIPEEVEFRRLDAPSPRARTLALGRLVLALDRESGELSGLQCFVKTGRWRTEGTEPPPPPDAEGRLAVSYPCGEEDFSYLAAEPRFLWHEESRSLRVALREGTALAFQVADCLLVGVDREGRLTDVWMLGLDLAGI